MATQTTNLGLTKPAGTEHALVSVINSNMDKIDAESGKVRGNFADDYDSTASYAVGDLCVYNGVLYRCNTAISGGEAWNSAHWDEGSVEAEVRELDSKIQTVANSNSIGTFSSKSALDTAIDTLLSSVQSNGIHAFSFATSSAFDVFRSTASFIGILYKSGSNTTFSNVEIFDIGTQTKIIGMRNGSGWSYAQIALDSSMTQSVLANGTNLNSLTIPYNRMPVWYCGNDISQMQNIPSELAGKAWPFSIECFYAGNGSSGYARQILHVYASTDSPSNIFVRNQSYTSGRNWLGWEKLALENEIVALDSKVAYTYGNWSPSFPRDTATNVTAKYARIGNIMICSAKWTNVHNASTGNSYLTNPPAFTGATRVTGYHGVWHADNDTNGECGTNPTTNSFWFEKNGTHAELPNAVIEFVAFGIIQDT